MFIIDGNIHYVYAVNTAQLPRGSGTMDDDGPVNSNLAIFSNDSHKQHRRCFNSIVQVFG